MSQPKRRRESGTCCLGCLGLPFALLGALMLVLSLQSALVLLWGREVPGRAEHIGLDRKQGYELRYSYIVRGRRYTGVTHVSEREVLRIHPAMPLKVRAFAPIPAGPSYVVGMGPSPLGTTLGLGALCIPVLLVGSLCLLALAKGQRLVAPLALPKERLLNTPPDSP